MRATSHGFVAACGGLALVVLAGCGRVLEYPGESPENSAALCSDGDDNDFDGVFDCADSGCDGFCVEETPSECNDGRDNDGDGLADAADPRCWLLTPPQAERCAEASGVEIIETFDEWFWWPYSGTLRGAWRWRAWGVAQIDGQLTDIVQGGNQHEGDGRTDGLVAFFGTAYYSDIPGTSLGSLVRQEPFSGSFQGFELSFSASVPPNAVLRAGIVPVELAPSASAPLSGAENGLLSVSIDTEKTPPELAITLSGTPFSAPIAGCVGCSNSMSTVRVVVDEQGLSASLTSLTSPDGAVVHVRPDEMTLGSVPPARLVFWGGARDAEMPVRLDDVLVNVEPELPCGFFAPQIPGPACEGDASAGAYGQSVSVARSASGEYCALVAARSADPERGPTPPAAEALTAWGSPDGEHWTPYSSLDKPLAELPVGTTLVGAGITSDEEGLHAAVAYRVGDAVLLGFVDGGSCDSWGPLESGMALFPDAEAPSYVITHGQHYIYYTRPPSRPLPDANTPSTTRMLWRVARDASEPETFPFAALDKEVGAPVSVTRVGSSDLVLAYPRATGTSNTSIGVLVGDRIGLEWRSIPQGSIIEPPPRPDLWEGQGRLAFDDRGVIAATLAWGANGGFVLYSGASTTGRVEAARNEPLLAAGTARLERADRAFARAAVVPDRCGDGTCGVGETCAKCEADCSCNQLLLTEVFRGNEPWQLVADQSESAVFEPTFYRYLSADPPLLNWVGNLNFDVGATSWSVLSLEAPIDRDFELSFDWLVRWHPPLTCTFYVGLGVLHTDASARAPSAGVFARMKKDETCVDGFFATPWVLSERDGERDPVDVGSCTGAEAIPTDRWQRVVLRRRGGELSVVTVRDDGCEPSEQRITDGGDTDLSSLLIGFGGDGFEDCATSPEVGAGSAMQGTIANLELRRLDGDR